MITQISPYTWFLFLGLHETGDIIYHKRSKLIKDYNKTDCLQFRLHLLNKLHNYAKRKN